MWKTARNRGRSCDWGTGNIEMGPSSTSIAPSYHALLSGNDFRVAVPILEDFRRDSCDTSIAMDIIFSIRLEKWPPAIQMQYSVDRSHSNESNYHNRVRWCIFTILNDYNLIRLPKFDRMAWKVLLQYFYILIFNGNF